MNRLCLAFFLFVLTVNFALAQNQPSAAARLAPEAEKASVEVVKLFKEQKFKEALPLARKAVEINSRELGAGHLKTAQAHVNLAYVLRALDNQKEAAAALEDAVAAFDKNPNLSKEDSLTLAQVLESLGYLKFDAGKEGGSEKYYKRALELRDKFNGAESKETAATLWSLGNLNMSVRDYDQAAVFYNRAYQIRLKNDGADDLETWDAAQRYTCTLLKAGKKDQVETFREKNKAALNATKKINAVEAGVINGKATNLAKPPYPAAAKKDRAQGTVMVNVMIDEEGKIIYACGADSKLHTALIEASEWAAYQSTFTPTTVAGKPVKVTGVIVYNFVPK